MIKKWECKRCGYCCTRMPKLDLTPDEIKYFPKNRYRSYIGYGKTKRDIKVVLYRLIGKRCPLYDEEVGCTIYENRPAVCKVFPVRHEGLDTLCKNAPPIGGPPMIVSDELVKQCTENRQMTTEVVKEMLESGDKIWEMKNFKWRVFNVNKLAKKRKMWWEY
jgi:Fe-S-cluster containining protein